MKAGVTFWILTPNHFQNLTKKTSVLGADNIVPDSVVRVIAACQLGFGGEVVCIMHIFEDGAGQSVERRGMLHAGIASIHEGSRG
eukprot:3151947-Amphidinium_carterae.2